ncbi:hypothetical protein K2X33_00795 [bacterium]|nr:hypothetical protein [bacterium]
MSHHTPNHASEPFDYTERQLPIKTIAVWVAILLAGVLATMAFVYFVYGTPTMHPDAELVLTRPMNQPALQSNGSKELKAFRAQQQEWMHSWGWINQAQGTVHMPIEVAIDKALEKGFPSRGAKE